MEIEVINALIASLGPSITAIITIIIGAIVSYKKNKSVLQSSNDEVRSMKKEYRRSNELMQKIVENNQQIIENYQKQQEIILRLENKIGDLIYVEKERLHQESKPEDMAGKSN